MKTIVLWLTIIGIGIGVGVNTSAQQRGRMQAQGGMMGGGMMGRGTMGEGMTGGNSGVAPEQEAAASVYATHCATCHGKTGNGDGPAAGALFPKPKDFADCKRMATISDVTLFQAIQGGGQSVGLSPLMPGWGGSLTAQQIHELVEYIRNFCGNERSDTK